MQSIISSASESSLSTGRETTSPDGELNRKRRLMRDGACGVSKNNAHAAVEDELQDKLSDDINVVYDAVDASSSFTVKRLKDMYQSHVLDAETRYHLHFNFCLPTDGEIKESEFDATPMVLLIGQYSTGKVCVLVLLFRLHQHKHINFLQTID